MTRSRAEDEDHDAQRIRRRMGFLRNGGTENGCRNDVVFGMALLGMFCFIWVGYL